MSTLYDVCYAGELLEGHDPATVRLKLAKLFKADETTLDKLFSGTLQMVKRNCDHATARKYKKAMEQAGAKTIVRSNTSEQQASAATPTDHSSNQSAPQKSEGEFDLAPTGSDVLRPDERPAEVSADIDTSGMEVMATGVDLSDGAAAPPPAPDTSHLSMGEVGEDIPKLESTVQALSPDISAITLSPEHADLSDCSPAPAPAPTVDLSELELAPSGADMLEEGYRKKTEASAPATQHLKLEDH
jgi:hypothetical protein